MAAITIRNLSDETHRALKARAAAHGRSTEAEVRSILDASITDQRGEGLGTRLARISSDAGGFDLDLQRDPAATDPIDLS